ncbi:MAG: HAMP domain-containing protein [Caldilineaceae bacterium]|nr:HAMP domain-containing protein [Caldilineaceae bacterium]
MRNQLWFKLTGAFALIIFIGMVVTVGLASQGAATQFEHFMVANQMVRPATMQAALANYYTRNGGWQGVDTTLDALLLDASDGMMTGMFGSMMGMLANRIQVLDAEGAVMADSAGAAGGEPVSAAPLEHWPVIVDDELVGELVVEGSLMGAGMVDTAPVVESITRTVFIAAVIAALTGLLLAAVLVRQITRPLVDLSHASRRIAAGDLHVRVPVKSDDEVGELTDTFNQMAASLEQQETLRQSMMADIAHELRTPLTGLQGAIEAMQDGVFPADAENLEALHVEVLLLNRLVDDLRTLANAEAGQLALEKAPVDVAELCRSQVNAMQFRAAEKGITLTATCPAQAPPVVADAQRLNQVLLNLIDNALRHTPAGGTIIATVYANATELFVTVTDDGPGIAAGDLPHLFDRFYRGDRSRTRATGGSGLGLAIARQIVEAHGGSMWVDSPPPGAAHGSEFGFSLPRTAIAPVSV